MLNTVDRAIRTSPNSAGQRGSVVQLLPSYEGKLGSFLPLLSLAPKIHRGARCHTPAGQGRAWAVV